MSANEHSGGGSELPLAGLQVVESSTYVAGPSGGMALAQFGADVIRVDPPGGAADFRRLPRAERGGSLYWTGLNKGKRSITVDTRTERGQELVTSLITLPGPDRGVFLTNAPDRGWASYRSLSHHRPDLIHLRIQGHRDGRPAVDYTVNAEAGVPGWTGSSDHAAPVNHALPAWDLLTGMTAVSGLLAALRHRDRTGHGRYTELALADVALATLGNLGWLAEVQTTGRDRPRHGNYLFGTFGCDFTTADDRRVMVVALTTGQWRALCATTGSAETLAALEKSLGCDFEEEESRYRYREVIAAVLRPWFARRGLEEVSADLTGTRVLWGRYRHITDIVAEHTDGPDPLVCELDQPDVGPVLATGSPLRGFGPESNTEPVPPAPAPRLGEHTEAVLCDGLGLSPREFGRLRDAGVVGAPVAPRAAD